MWEVHPVESPIVVGAGRSSKKELWRHPPSNYGDGASGMFQRFRQGIEIIFAIDEPFDLIPRSRRK